MIKLRSAVGFLLRSLIMFQTFISRHNSNFFSDKLVLTSVTPASQKKSRSEERFSRNAETDLVCRLLLEKKKQKDLKGDTAQLDYFFTHAVNDFPTESPPSLLLVHHFDFCCCFYFFFNDTATTEIYTLSLHDALPILLRSLIMFQTFISRHNSNFFSDKLVLTSVTPASQKKSENQDRKSGSAGMPRPISYAVFCLKKKKKKKKIKKHINIQHKSRTKAY